MQQANQQDLQPPPQFFKGVFIVPHVFNQPENSQHARWVHLEMRQDFYNQSVNRIFRINREEVLQIVDIYACATKNDWQQLLFLKMRKQKSTDIFHCQDWKVKSGKSVRSYRQLFLQSKEDRFSSVTIPDDWWQKIKLLVQGGE